MASATYNFDFRNCSLGAMTPHVGGTDPYIHTNTDMPEGDQCGARGDGVMNLPFKFVTGGFSVRWHLSIPGEDIGGNIHLEFMMLTADEQRGLSFVATRTAEIPTVIQQRVYQIEGGVKTEVGLLGATDAGGWQVMPAAAQSSGKFAVTFSYHNTASNSTLTTDIDVLMADVTKIVWHGNDESNASLLYGFLTGGDVEMLPEPEVEGIGLRVSSGAKNVTFGFGVTGGGTGSAEKNFDWLDCDVSPMVEWQDYDPPEIVTNDNMPTGQECSVLGVGQAPLGFTIEGLGNKAEQIGALLSVKVPFPPVGSGEANRTLWVGLVTDDGQNGSVMAISTNSVLAPYNLIDGVLAWSGVFGNNPEPYGTDSWSLLEFQIRWDFTSTVTVRVDVVNANDETNTVLNARAIGDVTAGVNTLLMSPDDLGAGSNTLGISTAYVQADIAEGDTTTSATITATNPLRLAFPHDIIFTSGIEMIPYSGFFFPPSTPIPPSQIYIPRGPDPITGEPNFKRMQWTITTADTPREILMGATPGGPV